MSAYKICQARVPLAVLPLDEICFPHDDRITTDGAMWWIAWHDKAPVGYAGLRPCADPANRGLGFLCRVGVLPDHRGHGLQRRMIRVREREARSMGLRELVTYCVPWNPASINSLIRCGYVSYTPASKWGGGSAIYMRKKL